MLKTFPDLQSSNLHVTNSYAFYGYFIMLTLIPVIMLIHL